MYEWYVPITILPGIGLLIISTSILLINLTNEISILLRSENRDDLQLAQEKLKQLNLLNLAMVGFYFSSATFVNSGILMILSTTFLWCRDISIYLSFNHGSPAVVFSFQTITQAVPKFKNRIFRIVRNIFFLIFNCLHRRRNLER